MPERKADATWNGGLEDGDGRMALGSGAFEGAYSFVSRFEDGEGTNPEELIGAAHAGCYSMALSADLEEAGYEPESVSTEATVRLEMLDAGPTITRIDLDVDAAVPGIDEDEFLEIAEGAKENCPVSKALAAVEEIALSTTLSN